MNSVEISLKQLYESVFVVLLAAAGSFHIVYVGLFLAFNLRSLVIASVLAIVGYTVAWRCLKRGWSYLALAGAAATALLHSAYASITLGWNSDFYLFGFPVLIFLLLCPYFGRALKLSILGALTISYVVVGDLIEPRVHHGLDTLVSHLEKFNNVSLCLFLGMIAYLYARAIKRATGDLNNANQELTRLATIDALSGLFNRRFLTEQVQTELARFRRTGHPFSVIVADIDNFKSINDTYGHQVGDRVITEVGQALRDSVRTQDRVARWGGEEFLVFLPETITSEAETVARRVQERLQRCAVVGLPPNHQIQLTFGVAEYAQGKTLDGLLAEADRALYFGKKAGKNRIINAASLSAAY
jgi:diguanylate cyclase